MTSKTDKGIGKAVLNNFLSYIFYQFGDNKLSIRYQFGVGDYLFDINSENNIINSVSELINSVKYSETFRESDRLFISIWYQFGDFSETVDRKSDR